MKQEVLKTLTTLSYEEFSDLMIGAKLGLNAKWEIFKVNPTEFLSGLDAARYDTFVAYAEKKYSQKALEIVNGLLEVVNAVKIHKGELH